jgi:hypothetical protein
LLDSPSRFAVMTRIAAVAPAHTAVVAAAATPLDTMPGQIG